VLIVVVHCAIADIVAYRYSVVGTGRGKVVNNCVRSINNNCFTVYRNRFEIVKLKFNMFI